MSDKKQSAVARRLAQLGDASITNNTTVSDQLLQNQVTTNSQTISNLNQGLSNLTQNTDFVSSLLNYNLDNSIPTSLAGRVTELENNPQGGGGIDPSDPTQPVIIVDNFIQQSNGNESGTGSPYTPLIFPSPGTPTSSSILTPTDLSIYENNSETDHLGVVKVFLENGTPYGILSLVNSPTIDSFVFTDINTVYFIIKTQAPTDTYNIKLGLFDDIDNPTQGVFFNGTSGANWVPTVNDGTTVTGTTTALSNNTWYTLKIQKKTSTSVGFTINSGTETVISTNIPTGYLTCGIRFENITQTQDISFLLDFFSLKLGDDPVVLPTGTTVEGTANEVEVTTLGSVITVGLPNDVTVTGTLTATDVHSKLSGQVVTDCKNVEGITLSKGTPVYISGTVGGSGQIEVKKSYNDDPTTMPAIGLLLTDLADTAFGHVVLLGSLNGVSTDIFNVGDTLYIDQLIGGTPIGLTNIRPTGEGNLVQNIGKVGRSQANTGEILVTGAGRTNAIPNNLYLADLVDGDPTDPTNPINFSEDFLTTSTEAGETGTHGWTVLTGSITAQSGTSDNPGVVRFRCGTGANVTASFSPSATATNNTLFGYSKFIMTQFIFKDTQTDTTTQRIYGVLDVLNSNIPLGMYIRKQQGTNQYEAVVKNQLTENTANLFVQDTNWRNVKIIKNNTTVSFIVNGNAPVDVNVPPSGNMPGLLTIGALLRPNAASINNTVDLDFWSFKLAAPIR